MKLRSLIAAAFLALGLTLVGCTADEPAAGSGANQAGGSAAESSANQAGGSAAESSANQADEQADESGVNQALVGTWAWEFYPDWEYEFRSDGTGERGLDEFEDYMHFTWSTVDGELHIDLIGTLPTGVTVRNERWAYSIAGNALTISSLQVDGLEFTYVRQ